MGILLLIAWIAAGPPPLQVAAPQAGTGTAVSIDRIVARVNDDIIQSLEVRRARLLKLFGSDVTTDDAVLDRLIDRRLELADAARYQTAEPPAADVAARRERWVVAMGRPSSGDVTAVLRDAGMTDDALTDWFRDDVRIEALENQRFSAAPATRDEMLTYVREHGATFSTLASSGSGGAVDVDDPAVQARARTEIGAAKRAAAVSAWVDSLRKRAVIIR